MKRIVFGLTFVLTACTGVPIDKTSEAIPPTHGYVYLNVPKAAANSRLTLRSIETHIQYELKPRSDAGIDAFGAWIPQGKYELFDWDAYQLDGYPLVNIEAKRLTDLGGLIPLQVGNQQFVVLPIRHPELATGVNTAASEYRANLVSSEPMQWLPEAPPKPIRHRVPISNLGLIVDLLADYERHVNAPPLKRQLIAAKSTVEFFRLAKAAMPPSSSEPAIDEQGNMYFSAELGQIRVRNSAGKWSSLDTGTMHPITAVEIHGNTLVSGADNGVIRASNDRGKTWKVVASAGADEAIIDIDRVGDRWIVISARLMALRSGAIRPRSVKVYMAGKIDFSDLNLTREISLENYAGPNPMGSSGGKPDGKFYYIHAVPDLQRLDLSSLDWKTITPPARTDGFNVSSHGGVIAAYRIQGAFSKLYVSTDGGDIWNQYDTPPYIIQDIFFATKNDGRAVRWSAGAFSGTFEIMQYDRGQDRWIKSYEAPQGCSRILNDSNDLPKLCVTKGGSILRYADPAWVVEFAAD